MKYRIEAIEKDDIYTFLLHQNGPKYFNVLEEIYRTLREKVKYTDEAGSWEEAYQLVIDLLNDANIDLYE